MTDTYKMNLLHEDGRTEEVEVPTRPDLLGVIAKRQRLFPVGTRVKLTALAQTPGGYDDSENLPPGSTGIVNGEPDAAGSLPIEWDHGAHLAATIHDRIERC